MNPKNKQLEARVKDFPIFYTVYFISFLPILASDLSKGMRILCGVIQLVIMIFMVIYNRKLILKLYKKFGIDNI